jgi:magnesium transporter
MDNDRLLSLQFIRTHTAEAARSLEKLPAKDISSFLEKTPPALAADIIRSLNPADAGECLNSITPKPCAAIVEHLPLEIASVLLRRLEKIRHEEILSLLPAQKADLIKMTRQYSQGTAGALMDPQVFTLPDDISVSEALKRIQKKPQNIIYYLYILDRWHHLTGLLTILQLLSAEPNDSISSVMHQNRFILSPETTYRAILLNPGWSEMHALPVADKKGIFLGAIGYTTLRFLEREAEQWKAAQTKYDAGIALGELYWIGVSSFLKGAAFIVNKNK